MNETPLTKELFLAMGAAWRANVGPWGGGYCLGPFSWDKDAAIIDGPIQSVWVDTVEKLRACLTAFGIELREVTA